MTDGLNCVRGSADAAVSHVPCPCPAFASAAATHFAGSTTCDTCSLNAYLIHPYPKRSTMKVYQLTLLSVSSGNPAKAAVLGSAQDLSSFSMFQRGSIAQFMSFFAQVWLLLTSAG